MAGIVDDYMVSKKLLVVEAHEPMRDVVKLMIEKDPPAIVVTDTDMRTQGIITLTDVKREIWKDLKSSRIMEGNASDIMTPNPISVQQGSLMLDALETMGRGNFHTLLILKAFRPFGMLTLQGVLSWWNEVHNNEEA